MTFEQQKVHYGGVSNSSHVSKLGSSSCRLVTEILPGPKTEAVNDDSLHTHYVRKEFILFPPQNETSLKNFSRFFNKFCQKSLIGKIAFDLEKFSKVMKGLEHNYLKNKSGRQCF